MALYVARSIGKYCQAEQLKQIGDPLFAIHVDDSTSYFLTKKRLEYWITFFGKFNGERRTEFIGCVDLTTSAAEIEKLLLADTPSKSPTM